MVYVKVFRKGRCFKRLTSSSEERAHSLAINSAISFSKKHLDTIFQLSDFEVVTDSSYLNLVGSVRHVVFSNGFSYECYFD